MAQSRNGIAQFLDNKSPGDLCSQKTIFTGLRLIGNDRMIDVFQKKIIKMVKIKHVFQNNWENTGN